MFTHAVIDSRNAGPSSLFFALPGVKTDGHAFVADVLGAGGAAVVSRDGFTGPILEVDSVEEALMEAGAWARDCIKYPVIGVTGSSGKTTTRKMLHSALSIKYKSWQTKGNLNNHLGLPLTLLNTPPSVEILVLEMGMNHAGELSRLGWAARPNLSLITNVGTAHIENFGSREKIIEAKAELLHCMAFHLLTQHYGRLVVVRCIPDQLKLWKFKVSKSENLLGNSGNSMPNFNFRHY